MTIFKIWLKGDDRAITIHAQSEKHARQAISRGRQTGRYGKGRIVKVETEAVNAPGGKD